MIYRKDLNRQLTWEEMDGNLEELQTQIQILQGGAPKTDQVITFPALPSKNTNSLNFSGGATASSGLAVSYTSSDESIATIVGNLIHVVSAGVVDITASQGGNAVFNPAPVVVRSLTIESVAVVPNRAQIIGEGDSIFAGTLAISPVAALHTLLGDVNYGDYFNSAVSGATAFQYANNNFILNTSRFSTFLARKNTVDYNQTLAVIMIGVNDLSTPNTIQQIVGNIFSWLTQVRQAGIKPIIVTTPADRRMYVSNPTEDEARHQEWIAVTSEIVTKAIQYGAMAVLDIRNNDNFGSWIAPISNGETYYRPDQLHPNNNGANYLAGLLQPIVESVRSTEMPGFITPPAYVYVPGDTTAPVLASAVVQNANRNKIVLTYNESINTETGLTAADFSVSGGKTVTAIAILGATITLTINSNYVSGDVIALSGGANKIKDTAGNTSSNLTAQAVTNNVAVDDNTKPTISSRNTASSSLIRMVFSEAVTVNTAGWSFTKNGANLPVSSVTGSGTVWDFVVTTIVSTDTLAFAYNSGTGTTADIAGNLLDSASGTVTNNVAPVVPTTVRIDSGNAVASNWNGYNFLAESYAGGQSANFGAGTIAATAYPEFYRNFRFVSSGLLTYSIPVVNAGSYSIHLHWADCGTMSDALARKFHIDINGNRVATDFSIYTEAGSSIFKAVIKTYDIVHAGGTLTIVFTKSFGIQFVAGIELVAQGLPSVLA